jgi:hypothetical protein
MLCFLLQCVCWPSQEFRRLRELHKLRLSQLRYTGPRAPQNRERTKFRVGDKQE